MSGNAVGDSDAKLISLSQARQILLNRRALLLQELARTENQTRCINLEYAWTYNRRSPILRIPTEITASIFEEAVGGGERGSHSDVACILSHVCHSWRLIALALPALWTSFEYKQRPSDLHRFPVYLQRSLNRLLDLRFEIGPEDDERIWRCLLRKAVEQVTRWRCLALLFASNMEYPHNIFAIFNRLSAPNLEVIEVGMSPQSEGCLPHRNSARPCFQGGAPKLEQARFDSWSVAACRSLSNVTTLQISHPRQHSPMLAFTAFLDLLKSSRLVNLSLSGPAFHAPRGVQQATVAPELKNFRVADCQVVASDMWDYVLAPKLELLIIIDVGLESSITLPFNTNLAHDDTDPGPFPFLHSLVLISCRFDRPWVSHIAQLTKNVTNLYVNDCNCTDYFSEASNPFTIMVDVSPKTIFWPQLRALYCAIQDFIQEREPDFKELLNFATYRQKILNSHCVLNLLDLDAKAWEEHDPDTWKELSEGGLFEEWTQADKWDFIPWPPRAFQKYESQWEDVFMTCYNGR